MSDCYVGTLSGTSADGIDVVVVDFSTAQPRLIAARTTPIPDPVREEIRALSEPADDEIERLGRLDVVLGRLIADAVNDLLAEAGIAHDTIAAIGSHGQTLRHRPDADPPFTLQVGDPNTVAVRTGIPVVADLRRMDMARGGQGAPLVPAFHEALFRDANIDRAVVNLGGIANITLLPRDQARPVTGFDTGPGNCLMDDWITRHNQRSYDADGAWAREGTVDPGLLARFLDDPYFGRPAPKSTGREHYHLGWIEQRIAGIAARPADVQATLLELTATSVVSAIDASRELPASGQVLACGGGIRNGRLMERLAALLAPRKLMATDALGIDGEWIEGCAFAWLARQRLLQRPGAIGEVTGASAPSVLGGSYAP